MRSLLHGQPAHRADQQLSAGHRPRAGRRPTAPRCELLPVSTPRAQSLSRGRSRAGGAGPCVGVEGTRVNAVRSCSARSHASRRRPAGAPVPAGVGGEVGLEDRDRGDAAFLRRPGRGRAQDGGGRQVDDVRADPVQQFADLAGGRRERQLPVPRQAHRPDGVHRDDRTAAGLVVLPGRRDHHRFVPAQGQVVGGPQHRRDDAVDRRGERLGHQCHAHGASRPCPGLRTVTPTWPDGGGPVIIEVGG